MKKLFITLGMLGLIYVLLLLTTNVPRYGDVVWTDDEIEHTEEQSPTNALHQTQVKLIAYSDEANDDHAMEQEGAFIAVSADYRKHLGFPGYVKLMKANGGRFFLFDATRNQLVAEVDPLSSRFSPIETDQLKQLSPRAREIHQEIAVSGVLKAAGSKYGERNYRIMLLLPQILDDRIQDSICRALQNKGIDPSAVSLASGYYGHHELRIDSVNHAQKGTLPASITIPL